MIRLFIYVLAIAAVTAACGKTKVAEDTSKAISVYDQNIDMETLYGDPADLTQYKGKVIMMVNTASKCGLTPQYTDLQALYEEYQTKDFVILGFPANNFMKQEPGSHDEIAEFCQKNYGVSFPMFEKISVKGGDIHPLYQFLTEKGKNGVMDSDVAWNFQKYILDKDGKLVATFTPKTNPKDEQIVTLIDKLL